MTRWVPTLTSAVFLLAVLFAVGGVSASASSPTGDCTISGSDARDALRGTRDDDIICGLGGDDVLLGLAGDDELRGGPGDDRLPGGAGADAPAGETRNDVLVDIHGTNHLDGGPWSRDRCIGGPATALTGCEVVRLVARPTRPVRVTPDARTQPAGTEPRFVPEASTVSVDANTVAVTFVEEGL